MRVTLDGVLRGDLDAAGLGDATDVVPAQVEQLQVFGAFLFVGEQFRRQRFILRDRGAALAGAGDGAQGDAFAVLLTAAFAFEAHEDFRRGADHLKIAEVEEEHVGRGVERAQRAVERQRAGAEGLAHALAQYHLHDVAIDDVLLGAAHGSLEVFLGKFKSRR